MTEGDLKDLHDFAEDAAQLIQHHPAAMQHNPDLQVAAMRLRDEAYKRYSEKVEQRYPHKRDDYVP